MPRDPDETAYRRDMRRLAVRAAELAEAVLEGRVSFEAEWEWAPADQRVRLERVRVVVEPRPEAPRG